MNQANINKWTQVVLGVIAVLTAAHVIPHITNINALGWHISVGAVQAALVGLLAIWRALVTQPAPSTDYSVTGHLPTPIYGHRFGTEIKRDHPLHADSPPPHDPSHPSRPLAKDVPWSPAEIEGNVLSKVRNARKYFPSREQVIDAHRRSPWRNTQLRLLNNKGTTLDTATFADIVKYAPFAMMRYVAVASSLIPKWECLDFAKGFWTWCIAIGIYPAFFILDFQGGHSYNGVCLRDLSVLDDDAVNAYVLKVYEPQANVEVKRLYPEAHYTGTGEMEGM